MKALNSVKFSKALLAVALASCALGFSVAQARTVATGDKTPFAAIPSYLKSTSTVVGPKVRPLFIIQTVPAGSFSYPASIGGGRPKARFYHARDLLDKATKRLGNNVQWAVYLGTEFTNSSKIPWKGTKFVLQDSNPPQAIRDYNARAEREHGQTYRPIGDKVYNYYTSNVFPTDENLEQGAMISPTTKVWGDAKTFMAHLNATTIQSNALFRPFTINYVVRAPLFMKYNIRYRCQPAFMLVIDDGLQRMAGLSDMDMSENAMFGISELIRHGYNIYPIDQLPTARFTDTVGYTIIGTNVYAETSGYDYACVTRFGGWRGQTFAKIPDNYSCGMGWFSRVLANTDLMTTADRGGVDDAGKSWDDPEFPKQTLKTFSIRIWDGGSDYSGMINEASPTSGGQSYVRMRYLASDPDNYFYNVKTGDELVTAFDEIVKVVADSIRNNEVETYSTISPSVGATDAKAIPGAAANVRLNMFKGASEIRFHKVDLETKQIAQPSDDDPAHLDTGIESQLKITKAEYTYPLFDDRQTMINVNGKSYLEYFGDSNLNNNNFGIENLEKDANKNEWKENLLAWFARSRTDAEIANSADKKLEYRIRKRRAPGVFNTYDMGDVIDSPVLNIGKYLVTAANDGMVYMFKETGDSKHPYTLALNYLPLDMVRESADDKLMGHYKYIVDPKYGTPEKPHQFMINGGLVWRLTQANAYGNKNLIIAGNMGQGGRGTYVLRLSGNDLQTGDETGIEAYSQYWTRSVPMFHINANDYKELGYTFGDPQIGVFSDSRRSMNNAQGEMITAFDSDTYNYGLFLSSGFNNPSKGVDDTESALYVFNIFGTNFGGDDATNDYSQGKLVKKIVADQFGGGLTQSTLVDMDNDGVVDVAYAASYNGGLYRFDFRQGMGNATVNKIFQAKRGQKVTSAPAVYRIKEVTDVKKQIDKNTNNYMVIFGTGSDIYDDRDDNKEGNSIYGIRDNLADFNPPRMDRYDLVQQFLTSNDDINQYGSVSKNGADVVYRLSTQNEAGKGGWFMDLPQANKERIVSKPFVYDGNVIFTTRFYTETTQIKNPTSGSNKDDDPCLTRTSTSSSSGYGWIMQLEAESGAMHKGFDMTNKERESSYVDFLDKFHHPDRPIVTGMMDPSAGIPSVNLSGDRPQYLNPEIVKGETNFKDRMLPLDANFEGDIGGSGISRINVKLTELKQDTQRNYVVGKLKYDRTTTLPSLFVSTSIKGLEDPYGVFMKVIKIEDDPKKSKIEQKLKRISYKIVGL